MVTKPTSLVQFRIDPAKEEQANIAAEAHYKGNSSAFYRDATDTLLMYLQLKDKLATDKDKSAFFEQLEKNLKSEQIFKFLETLDETMLGALGRAVVMTKEAKHQNAKLL